MFAHRRQIAGSAAAITPLQEGGRGGFGDEQFQLGFALALLLLRPSPGFFFLWERKRRKV